MVSILVFLSLFVTFFTTVYASKKELSRTKAEAANGRVVCYDVEHFW